VALPAVLSAEAIELGRSARHPAWLPTSPDPLALHERMRFLRDKLYAHTDEEIAARWIHGMNVLLQSDHVYIPAWRPEYSDDLFDSLFLELAESPMERFANGVQELRGRIKTS
jgi:hypothetical protein